MTARPQPVVAPDSPPSSAISPGSSAFAGVFSPPSLAHLETRLFRNSLHNSAAWLANALLNLLATPVLVVHLGPEGYGLYALLVGMVGYFYLLDLGLEQGLVRFAADFRARDDDFSLHSALSLVLLFQCSLGSVGVALVWIFDTSILRLLRVPPALFSDASLCLRLSALGYFCALLAAAFSAVLRGLQRYDAVARTVVSISTLATLATLVAVLLGGRLRAAVLISVLAALASLLLFARRVLILLPAYRFNLCLRLGLFRRLGAFSSYLFLCRLAWLLNSQFVRLLISAVLGPAAVTLFVVPMRLLGAIEAGLGSLFNVLFPFAADLAARGRSRELQLVYLRSSRLLAALATPLLLFVSLFAAPLLTLWMGPSFAQRVWPVQLLLGLAILLSLWTVVPANLLFGIGSPRVAALLSLVVVALNLLFGLLFTRTWGVTGTAAAVLLTAVQGPILIWHVTVRVAEIPWKNFLRDVFLPHLAPASALVAAAVLLQLLIPSHTLPSTLGVLAAALLLTLAYYLHLFRRRPGKLPLLWDAARIWQETPCP